MNTSQKLIPRNPADVMVIRKVTDNITTLSVPFARFGRIKFGGRGTIVKLQSGALAVFSPVALTDRVKEELQQLGGTVKYIAALDLEHHIFLHPWHEAFPDAKILAPDGLKEKRDQQKNEKVPFHHIYNQSHFVSGKGPSIDEEFDREFDVEYVPGHGNKEIVFNFKRDRTLIEGDLLFNLPALEQYSKSGESPHSGLLTKLFINLNGITGSALNNQRRFIWYATSSGDRPAFNKSIGRIDKWDFDRIIPCHGDVIETGGKGVFRQVMAWHLKALSKDQPEFSDRH